MASWRGSQIAGGAEIGVIEQLSFPLLLLDASGIGRVGEHIEVGGHAEDRGLLLAWHEAFYGEMHSGPGDVTAMVDDRLSYGGITLWETAGTAVSMAGVTRLLAGHVRGLAQQAVAAGDDNMEAGLGRQVAQALAAQAGRYPRTLAAFTESGSPGGRDNALSFGIDRILDGLGVLIAAR